MPMFPKEVLTAFVPRLPISKPPTGSKPVGSVATECRRTAAEAASTCNSSNNLNLAMECFAATDQRQVVQFVERVRLIEAGEIRTLEVRQ